MSCGSIFTRCFIFARSAKATGNNRPRHWSSSFTCYMLHATCWLQTENGSILSQLVTFFSQIISASSPVYEVPLF